MSLCVFFIMAFLQKGISDSSVHISQKKKGGHLNVTCVLSAQENLTQVNWETLQGSNRTNMAIFHPQYDCYIQSEHKNKVLKIEGRQYPRAYSSISLELATLNKSEDICCVFMTFPSGVLRQCTKITDNEEDTDNITKTEAQVVDPQRNVLKLLGMMIMSSIFSLVFITTVIYFCHRCCCKRKQVFNVQQAHRTDPSTSRETHTGGTPEVQQNMRGFDPAKLYAKIKEDLYYGRLWKSYQGRARMPTQGSPCVQRQVSSHVYERPPPKCQQEENLPKEPETATSSLDSNN